eukprot:2880460-Pyramimonas_sp.AAC.1
MANGGDVHSEWPRNCRGSKLFPRFLAFFSEAEMGMASFDGRQVGATNSKGRPIYKPWTAWTRGAKSATMLRGNRCPDPDGHGHAD